MKSALGIAIVATVLTFAAAAPTDATVLLDDTFADGTRTNQNLPTDSAWFFSTAADVMTTTGSMSIETPSGAFMGITYFGTNSSSPVQLGIGDMLTATITFTLNNVAPLNTSQGFRLGLFDFADSTLSPKWVTADGFSTSSQGTNVQGYALFQNMGVAFNNATPMSLTKRTTATDSSLLGTSGDWTSQMNGPGNTNNFHGFASGGQYLLQFMAQRADAVSLVLTVTWQNLANGASLSTVLPCVRRVQVPRRRTSCSMKCGSNWCRRRRRRLSAPSRRINRCSRVRTPLSASLPAAARR